MTSRLKDFRGGTIPRGSTAHGYALIGTTHGDADVVAAEIEAALRGGPRRTCWWR